MKRQPPTLTAIIPAYNEVATIGRAIEELCSIRRVSEIVAVNDGSTDATGEILQAYKDRAVVLANPKNRGKGYSVARALEVATGDLVLLLDADVINYTERDVNLLIQPVLSGQYHHTLKPTDDYIFRRLSGIRCYWRKDLIPLIPLMKASTRYGLEVILNKNLGHKRWKYVELYDYKHFQKFEKYKLSVAFWEYLKEGMSLVVQMLRRS